MGNPTHFQRCRLLGEVSSISIRETADKTIRVFVEIDGDQIEVLSASLARGKGDPSLIDMSVSRDQVARLLPVRKRSEQ